MSVGNVKILMQKETFWYTLNIQIGVLVRAEISVREFESQKAQIDLHNFVKTKINVRDVTAYMSVRYKSTQTALCRRKIRRLMLVYYKNSFHKSNAFV